MTSTADIRRMGFLKHFAKISIAPLLLAAATVAHAAQLSTDARTVIPHEVQQLVVIDYRAMENSPAAMDLRGRVMPPELKQFDEALQKSGLNENHDVDQLAFALFRPSASSDTLTTVGVAQGQFPVADMLANFKKDKVKPTVLRTKRIYPKAKTGKVLCFVDQSTMVFGSKDAVQKALDARDGVEPNMLTNNSMMDAMKTIDTASLWSILDEKGTQTMMKQVLGEAGAGSVSDFDTVKKRLQSSWQWNGLRPRSAFRSDDLDRRHICRGHDLVAADGGGDAEKHERLGNGEAGPERYEYRIRCGTHVRIHFAASDAGLLEPVALTAFSEHGSVGAQGRQGIDQADFSVEKKAEWACGRSGPADEWASEQMQLRPALFALYRAASANSTRFTSCQPSAGTMVAHPTETVTTPAGFFS